jgi:hypothetical protein
MTAPFTQGDPAHIAKGQADAIAVGAFAGLAGRGATAPGAVVIRALPDNEMHPFVVHFLNTQDGAYYFGDYCESKDEAYKAMRHKLDRYDPDGILRRAFRSDGKID